MDGVLASSDPRSRINLSESLGGQVSSSYLGRFCYVAGDMALFDV